jgi:hypothetical protein
MSTTRVPGSEPALLPELEQILVRAARRRKVHRFPRRRLMLAVALGMVVLGAGVATATGVFDVTSGKTAHGTFTVERRSLSSAGQGGPAGSICLELTYSGAGTGGTTSYGCGRKPTDARPFGVVIVDYLAEGLHEEVAYGLVAAGIARVAVLGPGGRRTYATTEIKEGLPGRFFAVTVPHRGQVEVVGYGADGRARARIGSLSRPDRPSRSKAQAAAQGEQMGFAPTIATQPRAFFEGHRIRWAEVHRLRLSCAIGRTAAICFRTGGKEPGNLISKLKDLEEALKKR